jgi:hypothetical protein
VLGSSAVKGRSSPRDLFFCEAVNLPNRNVSCKVGLSVEEARRNLLNRRAVQLEECLPYIDRPGTIPQDGMSLLVANQNRQTAARKGFRLGEYECALRNKMLFLRHVYTEQRRRVSRLKNALLLSV